jgi:hypothetical protein
MLERELYPDAEATTNGVLDFGVQESLRIWAAALDVGTTTIGISEVHVDTLDNIFLTMDSQYFLPLIIIVLLKTTIRT